jgi:hypothetical protein
LVDSCAVGAFFLIAYTIFSFTHSFLPAALPVFNSFWQHCIPVTAGIITILLLGKPFRRMKPTLAINVIVGKEITASRREEKN